MKHKENNSAIYKTKDVYEQKQHMYDKFQWNMMIMFRITAVHFSTISFQMPFLSNYLNGIDK